MAKRQSVNLKEYRKQVAALKRAGLVSSRIDARSHQPTRYMKAQLKKYEAVLKGEAKTLRTQTASTAKQVADEYKQIQRKGKVLIVPTQASTNKISLRKSDNSIRVNKTVRGQTFTTTLQPKDEKGRPRARDARRKRSKRTRQRKTYMLMFPIRGAMRFDSWNVMMEFLSEYSDDSTDYILSELLVEE